MADSNTPRPDPADGGRSLQALERLRERVEAAAREIARLRAENAALAVRVRELDDADTLGLAFDEEPEALRAKVQGFIDAIDRVLTEPADAEPSEPSS